MDKTAVTEEIIWEGSQSQVLNFGTFILMGLALVVILVLGFMFFPLASALAIVPLVYIFIKWIIVRNHRYKITTERIFYTTGIFSKNTEVLELYRVRDIDMYEPFWERMFKLGNIKLTTFDKTSPVFLLRTVPNPSELLNKIRTNVELRRDKKRVRGVEYIDDEGADAGGGDA